jgi:uncharacterized phage protein gp47/JayE
VNLPCGCCTKSTPAAPIEVRNRPGLSSIAYRVGTFATFREALLERFASTPELAGLRTRANNDHAVGTVELWAAVADVLTFYQERIANEGYLGTAKRRDSLARMVGLLDYELHPGAAAETLAAFVLEAGTRLCIPAGLRVQSVPAADEKPQKYETLEALDADARLNRLRIRPEPTYVHPLAKGRKESTLAPGAEMVAAAAELAPGDRVLMFADGPVQIVVIDDIRREADLITLVWERPLQSDDFMSAEDPVDDPDGAEAGAWKLGRSFRLFGHDAPPTYVRAERQVANDATSVRLVEKTMPFGLTGAAANNVSGNGTNELYLDATVEDLAEGSELLIVYGGTVRRVRLTAAGPAKATRGPLTGSVTRLTLVTALTGDSAPLSNLGISDIGEVTLFELIGPRLRFWPYEYAPSIDSRRVVVRGRRSGWHTIELEPAPGAPPNTAQPRIRSDEVPARRRVLLSDSAGRVESGRVLVASLAGSGIEVGAAASDPNTIRALLLAPDQARPITALVGSPVVAPGGFGGQVRTLAVTIGDRPTQTLTLAIPLLAAVTVGAIATILQAAIRQAQPDVPAFADAQVFAVGDLRLRTERLAIVPGAAGAEISFGPTDQDPDGVSLLGLDRLQVHFADGLRAGPYGPRPAVSGSIRVTSPNEEPRDLQLQLAAVATGELAAFSLAAALEDTGAGIAREDGDLVFILPPIPRGETVEHLRLDLAIDGPVVLDADSAVLRGNVARVGHGETVREEILGDGDAARAFQRFTISKKPVTHVAAATPSGVRSDLRVYVNGSEWRQVPTLYGTSSREEIYRPRVGPDGTLLVQLGDGRTGARAPTGRANIVATYRHGLGLEGRVRAGALTSLLDRPAGLRGVTNLLPSDGGADPETIDRTRSRAPGTVRTFGRAISLRDIEDLVRASGEVAKAAAAWVWTHDRGVVHLTVAGAGGGHFSPDGLDRIRTTIGMQRDPNHELRIDNVARVSILMSATLTVDDRRVRREVLSAARAALLDALSFEALGLVQPVHLSHVVAVLQRVPGVVAVDVDELDFKETGKAFRDAHVLTGSRPEPRLRLLPARPQGTSGAQILPAEQARVEDPDTDLLLRAVGGQEG